MTPDRVVVLGGGSWGATLADLLAHRGHDVFLWEFVPETARRLREERRLSTLPELNLHPAIQVSNRLEEALRDRPVIVSVVPSEHVRATWKAAAKAGPAPDAWVISATKGIENNSLKRMSEVIAEEAPSTAGRVAVLSGPSHAEEVVKNVPTAVVAAGPEGLPQKTHSLFNSDRFRVYTSSDFIGVELGGALKNVYAVACGISDGLGLGDNAKAALMTRGLNEMARLGSAAGAQGVTFFGLSGMGDLIVTCMSRHSRNRLLGEKIGKGKNIEQSLSEMTMVAEGYPTCKSAKQMADRLGLDLPIIDATHRCLYEGEPAERALKDLMARPVAGEMDQMEPFFTRKGDTHE